VYPLEKRVAPWPAGLPVRDIRGVIGATIIPAKEVEVLLLPASDSASRLIVVSKIGVLILTFSFVIIEYCDFAFAIRFLKAEDPTTSLHGLVQN
jgi:hypothetical protein